MPTSYRKNPLNQTGHNGTTRRSFPTNMALFCCNGFWDCGMAVIYGTMWASSPTVGVVGNRRPETRTAEDSYRACPPLSASQTFPPSYGGIFRPTIRPGVFGRDRPPDCPKSTPFNHPNGGITNHNHFQHQYLTKKPRRKFSAVDSFYTNYFVLMVRALVRPSGRISPTLVRERLVREGPTNS